MKKFSELRVKFHMAIGISNATQYDDFPLSDFTTEEEWKSLTQDKRDELICEWANDWSSNYLDLGGYVE